LKHAEAIAGTAIVSSFSTSAQEAFHKYFALLEEYQGSADCAEQVSSSSLEKLSFSQTLKAVRQHPAMYLGYPTFLGCCSYLMGDERAYADLKLPEDEDREIFRSFQTWVEIEKNGSGLSRSWHKIIEFRSGGIDCGHTASGAWSHFWRWLDQYTQQIGKGGVFGG
jgi:hypothetical protein